MSTVRFRILANLSLKAVASFSSSLLFLSDKVPARESIYSARRFVVFACLGTSRSRSRFAFWFRNPWMICTASFSSPHSLRSNVVLSKTGKAESVSGPFGLACISGQGHGQAVAQVAVADGFMQEHAESGLLEAPGVDPVPLFSTK